MRHHVTAHASVRAQLSRPPGIKSKEDVLAMGIDKYNEACRAIVMRYSKARAALAPGSRHPAADRACTGVGEHGDSRGALDRL